MNLDTFWVIACAGVVFLMQAGFLCLETGLTQSKHCINVAVKNGTDFAVSFLLFWAVGFGVMFGTTFSSNSSDQFFVSLSQGSTITTSFLFHAMFCATAATIVSGAVAGRMKLTAYLITTAIVSGLIYPLFGSWVWGKPGAGISGWLNSFGFVDFAGSTVVHGIGAWSALAAAIVIGPRLGRFDKRTSESMNTSSNLPLAMLGALLLAAGWLGFNGGSTGAFTENVPAIMVNTLIAACVGMLTAIIASTSIKGFVDVKWCINGLLGGLVAVTAGCHAMSGSWAAIIGTVAAIVVIVADSLLVKLKVDDVVGAISVHGAAGVWGTLAVAVACDPEALATGLPMGRQLLAQGLGVTVSMGFAFGTTFILLKLASLFVSLRSSAEEERVGMNISEHGASTEVFDLLSDMENQKLTGEFTRHVNAEPFTEVGQIARQYNQVLDRMNAESDRVKQQAQKLSASNVRAKAAQKRLQAILNSSTDPMIAFDDRGQIQLASQAVNRVFGWKSEELVGKHISVLIAEETRTDCIEHAASIKREVCGSHVCELIGLRRDESKFPCTWSVWNVEASEPSTPIQMGIVRDITDQVAAQEALRHKERELRQAQKLDAIGSLAGGVAHEYNNLLQAIRGFTQFALDELDSEHPAAKDLEQVIKTADRAASLTRQLLSFSRSESLVSDEVNTNEVITELLRLLRPLIGSQVNIKVALDENIGNLSADSTMVQQMLMNLCINARDAMPDGGEIMISTRDVNLCEEYCQAHNGLHPGRHVRIALTDTGTGMSPELIQRIFDPFFTTKVVGKGTGLGLAMVYGLVQQHGGTIHVYSEVGMGTTFKIHLPVSGVASVVSVPESIDDARGGSELILIAEDEPLVRAVSVRLLTRAGYRTIEATDGQEAIDLFIEHQSELSLVLLDVVMPNKTGREACDSIQIMQPGFPVVFCTGFDPAASNSGLSRNECFPVVEKPFEPARLLSVIRKTLDAARTAQELVLTE